MVAIKHKRQVTAGEAADAAVEVDYTEWNDAHDKGAIADVLTDHNQAAHSAYKLDDWALPDDNTDLDASTTAHGLLPKLDNDPTHFLDGQGNWSTGGLLQVTNQTLTVAVTTITITGLDLDGDKFYEIWFAVYNPTAGTPGIYWYYNNDAVAAHYYRRYLRCSPGGQACTPSNNASIGGVSPSVARLWKILVSRPANTYVRAVVMSVYGGSPTTPAVLFEGRDYDQLGNVTRFDFTCSAANGIGIGSHLLILKPC